MEDDIREGDRSGRVKRVSLRCRGAHLEARASGQTQEDNVRGCLMDGSVVELTIL